MTNGGRAGGCDKIVRLPEQLGRAQTLPFVLLGEGMEVAAVLREVALGPLPEVA